MNELDDYKPEHESDANGVSISLGVVAREALRQVGAISAMSALLWAFGGPATRSYIEDVIALQGYASDKDLKQVSNAVVELQSVIKERSVENNNEMNDLRKTDTELLSDQKALAVSVTNLSDRLGDLNDLISKLNTRLDNLSANGNGRNRGDGVN